MATIRGHVDYGTGKLPNRFARPIGEGPLAQPAPAAKAEPKATWDTKPAAKAPTADVPALRAARLAKEPEPPRAAPAPAPLAVTCDPGPPPELTWLAIADLEVDRRYQRDMVTSKASRGLVHRIATGWKWALYQPLTVAQGSPADDGSRGRYAVIDGQHRLAAAQRRGFDRLFCYVIDAATVEEQAGYFVGLNRERKALLPTQLHRAAAVAGDAEAMRLDAVCTAAGVRIGTTSKGASGLAPGETLAVGKLRQLIARHGEPIVTDALRLLVDAAGDKRDQLKAEMIAGVATLLSVKAWSGSMDRDKLLRVLRVNSTQTWIFRARDHKTKNGGNTSGAIAALLVTAYGVAR